MAEAVGDRRPYADLTRYSEKGFWELVAGDLVYGPINGPSLA